MTRIIILIFTLINLSLLSLGQSIMTRNLNIQFTSKEISTNDLFLVKENLGSINISVDSSKRLDSEAKKTIAYEYEVSNKFVKNIGFGTPVNLKEPVAITPQLSSHNFNGFRANENANYAISKIDIEDNLLSNEVSIIHMDSKNQVWIGYKNAGFSCLSTNKIIHYNDIVQFSTIEITCIIEYNQKIWIGTKNNGLLCLFDDKVKIYNSQIGLPSDHISNLCVDANNHLWISTNDSGIFRLDNGVFYDYNKLHSGISLNIPKIEFNKSQNKIWFYDDNNNILNVDNTYNLNILNYEDLKLNKSIEDINCSDEIHFLYKDNSIGTVKNNTIEITKIDSESENCLYSTIHTAKSGNVFAGGKSGEILIKRLGYTTKILSKNGISNNKVSKILQDQDGQIWISTLGNGIFRISKSNFATLFNSKDDYFVASPSLTSNDSNLIFQGAHGLALLDQKLNLIFYDHPQLIQSNSIYSTNGNIYIASNTGFYIIENDSLFRYSHPLKSQEIFNHNLSISEGTDSNSIIISNLHYGLYSFYIQDHSFKTIDLNIKSEIDGTYKDSSGKIWIANHTGKIQYIEGNRLFEADIIIPSIRGYIQDNIGQIWIITKKGFYYLNKTGKIFQIRVKNQSISNDFRSISIDNNGDLLVGTQKNLLKIQTTKPHKYKTFTKEFGINGSSYALNSMVTFGNGIYFATNKGIVKYTPFDFTKNNKLEITFSKIQINNIDINSGVDSLENLVLSNNGNKISIFQDFESFQVQLYSNYWGNSENLSYYYRINNKGSNKSEWQGPVAKGKFIFNTLKNGTNKIEFKVVSLGGVSSNILQLEVNVIIPIYRQGWFITIIISVLIFIVILIFKDKLSFNFKSLQSYSSFSTYVYKTQLLSILLLVLFPSFEYIFGSRLALYEPEYLLVGALMTLVSLILLISFSKRISYTSLVNFTLINSIVILYFICFRSFKTGYSFIFTVESMVIIAFIVFVMEDMKRYLIFLGFAICVILISLIDFDLSNIQQILFLVGNILLISFTVIYQIFKSSRTAHINFSENVLNTYDKLVIVYNLEGKVVYFNNTVKTFFNCGEEELLGDNWFEVRGISNIEKDKIQLSIREQIENNNVIDFLEEELFSIESMSYQTIKWEFQNLDNQFLMAIGSDITWEKAKEKEIIQLSQIAESVNSGISRSDLDGKLLWCNSSYEEITGYSFSELKGRRLSEVIKTPDFFKDEYKKILSKDLFIEQSFTVAHYNKRGDLIYLMINITPVYENGVKQEIIEILTDVTEQKLKETDFKRLSLIAQHTQNPTLLISKSYEVKWYNGAFVKEFGFAEEYLEDHSIKRLFNGPNNDDSQFERFQNRINKGRKATEEVLIYNILHEPVWMQISMDPIHDDRGEVVEYICIMQNIQNIKETQSLLEDKNKDVLDSIAYALRIQRALLPNLKLLKKNLPPHFMYYKPKDIVSGDFYFVEMKGDKLFIAVADCTGHGVPGAMITSIGSAALNNAIIDKDLKQPGDILEYVDLYLKNSLSTNTEELSDGMDIGIIAINYKNGTLEYAGAKRPLILIGEDGEIQQIDGTKKSIGEFSFGDQYKYITHSIDITETLNIYCFSDGVPDQFGGIRKKKMYHKNVLAHLKEHSDSPLDVQHTKLSDKLIEWTGDFQTTEQTDDMVLFGARLTPSYMTKMKRIFAIED